MDRASAYLMTLYTLFGDRFQGRKDRGATAVEYGLMVGLIAIVIIVAVTALGTQLESLFETVRDRLQAVNNSAA